MKTEKNESRPSTAAQIESRIRALPSWQTQVVRALRRQFSKELSTAPPREVKAVALTLLEQNEFVFRFVAYELVCHHKAALRSLKVADLKAFGRGIDSWADVDTFALFLAGPAWRERQVPDSLIHQWARSRDRWWRRTALVCTVALNNKARGGTGDLGRTLDICESLVADRDDMVVKAMSWALREMSRREPDSIRAFVKRHHKALAPRVIREVGHKITTGLKNPRKQR